MTKIMTTREELKKTVEDALADYEADRAAARASADVFMSAWKALAAYDEDNK